MTARTRHAPAGATRTADRPASGVHGQPGPERAASIPRNGLTEAERAIIAEMQAEIRVAMDRATARLAVVAPLS